MADKNLTNIQIYQRKTKYNIGVILFGIIFIYLVITILAYVTNKKVSIYEVREGSILKDNAYTGLVLRDEQIVKADSDGYVNYFVTEGSKVGSKTNVYSISQNKLGLDDQDASTGTEDDSASSELTAEEQASIIQKAHSFTESFRSQQYNDVYNFKNTITDVVLTNTAQSRQARLQALVDAGTSGITVHTADSDGVVVYTIDGYESLTKDDVTTDILEKKNYESTTLSNDTLVNSGDPVYKLIMSDDWTVVIELSDTMAQQLAEQSSVKVKFSKDNETTWTALQIYNTKDSNLAYLTFDHSMIRYATERYLDIELILEDESGLKIPKTAVTEKEFYIVPQDYITSGGGSNNTGVLVQGKKNSVEFQEAAVYYRDIETDMAYLDMDSFKEGTVLQKPDSGDTYTLSKTAKLSGVYNINKGYAVFRQINILCEGEEYYIIEDGNDYGLSNFDHIALDSKNVHENDIVF